MNKNPEIQFRSPEEIKAYQESRLAEEWLNEAKRVAREKIIIKAHFRDTVFEELGFERQVRPNQKLHYGLMDLSEGH